MGCNFSNKTVNSIEKRKNDIISMTAIKDGIELIRFIKMPSFTAKRINSKSQADETTQGPAQSVYSVHSNVYQHTNRNSHSHTLNVNQVQDSNNSVILSEREMPNGEKVYDHRPFLERNPHAKLVSITIFGYNYITAIETKFLVPGDEQQYTFLHSGSMHENSRRNEIHKENIVLEPTEYIETISCCCSVENHRIRSLMLGTTYEKC